MISERVKILDIDSILHCNKSDDIDRFKQSWPTDSTVVLTLFWETREPDYWQEHLVHLLFWQKKHHPGQRIFLALNTWYRNWCWTDIQSQVCDLIFVDFFLLYVWLLLDQYHLVQQNKKWNKQSNRFLFLIGKPQKTHRIRLLWKLSKTAALANADWSFYVSPNQYDHCHSFIPELTKPQYDCFLNDYHRLIDVDQASIGCVDICGAADIYQHYSFGVVSESDFDRLYSYPWITEKTWLHIANRIPFITVGEHGTSKLLAELGIDCYSQYMAVPNFDQPDNSDYLTPSKFWFEHVNQTPGWSEFYQGIKDPTWPEENQLCSKHRTIVKEIKNRWHAPIQSDNEQRLNSAVTNVLYWSETAEWKKKIGKVIDRNYKRYCELATAANNDLQLWLDDCGIDISSADVILDKSRFLYRV